MRLPVVLTLTALSAGAFAAPTAGLPDRAALRLSDESPLAFTGAGFRASEHVKVVAFAGRRAMHEVTAGTGGRFVVRFRGMSADLCRGLTATAIGDRGTRATYKRAPGQCPAD